MPTINLIFLFVLPLVVTGLIHHFVIIRKKYLEFLAIPVDRNISYNGSPLFGSKKTWRGILIVISLNSLISYLLGSLFMYNSRFDLPMWIIGGITGIGYSIAELPTSFIKRRMNIAPSGQAAGFIGYLLYILDQSDSVLGSVIALNISVRGIAPIQNLIIAVVGISIHIFLDILLHKFGYKITQAKPECIKKLVSP
jgi:hypothetical protein